ncbi:membrane protein [Streptococcus suis]|uniref:Membrane protein n=2 Tax=Streptococcus suis TaxID=1307 RepID=A0A116LQP7_STRSU|nr:membrane protein [Streptococcus suis]
MFINFLTKIIVFLTKILVKKKKKCYNDIKIKDENEFIRQEKESWGITMKKINSNKNGILITGTSVIRGVQVLVALYLIYSFVQLFIFGQEIDTMPLLMMMNSLLLLEVTLSREKEKKNEQDN